MCVEWSANGRRDGIQTSDPFFAHFSRGRCADEGKRKYFFLSFQTHYGEEGTFLRWLQDWKRTTTEVGEDDFLHLFLGCGGGKKDPGMLCFLVSLIVVFSSI